MFLTHKIITAFQTARIKIPIADYSYIKAHYIHSAAEVFCLFSFITVHKAVKPSSVAILFRALKTLV